MKAILFDLGNTLTHYYELAEFPAILQKGILNVAEYVTTVQPTVELPPDLSERVNEENHESPDYRVRPLEERLARIFGLDMALVSDEQSSSICRRFMEPIFARGHVYDDVFETLRDIRSDGYKIGLVSNTSWGSPAYLWREEIARLGLGEFVDEAIFCRDVGWRKPDGRIFTFALQRLGTTPRESTFIGDEPRWDLVGPRSVGRNSIVIDRTGRMQHAYPDAIRSLSELAGRMRELGGRRDP